MRLIDKNKTITDIKNYQAKVNTENNFSHVIYAAIQEIVRIVERETEITTDADDDLK